MQGWAQEKIQPALARETHYRTVPLKTSKQKTYKSRDQEREGQDLSISGTIHRLVCM